MGLKKPKIILVFKMMELKRQLAIESGYIRILVGSELFTGKWLG